MNLRLRIAIFIGGILLITTLVISSIAIYSIQTKSDADIESFRQEEVSKAESRLQNVVDLAYGIIERAHANSITNPEAIDEALDVLSTIRFDGKEGYFWITDTQLPYPTMIMHAAKPQNKGKVMSDEKYNVVEGKEGKNLYQERVEQSLANSDAFVDYYMVKPDEDKVYSKLSYSKLFKPMNWVISSGIYTDSIDEAVILKRKQLDDQLSSIGLKIVMISLGLLILGLYIGWHFSNRVVSVLDTVKERLNSLSIGRVVKPIEEKREDELGEMIFALNHLIDSTSRYIGFAKEIQKGNLAGVYDHFDEENVLGTSLVHMRTNLLTVLEETQKVLYEAGDLGKLDSRINTSRKEGIWKELGESINYLLDSISKPILNINSMVNKLADGDLTVRYAEESKGDVRLLTGDLNKAIHQLNELLTGIKSTTDVVEESANEMLVSGEEMSRSTSEIASATGEMSSGTQTQVSKVDEASQLIERILNSSDNMKERAISINDAAALGFDNSVKGKKMLEEIVGSIDTIFQCSNKTNDSIEILKGRSSEISQVLNVITEIASQTNLLALNAAIEAAQAGDAGRGFAVVAEEIRKLAEDSRKSAIKIEQLVSDVQNDTEEAAKTIDQMSTSVKSGADISKEASGLFKDITDSTQKTLQLSEEIASVTKGQLEDIHNVVGITENIVVVAEETAAGTEEVASSAVELASGMDNYQEKSKQLTSIAAKLKENLEKFKLS
ncbi:methyl-accepting chemotaxis protein [Ekhidna sp.]